MLLSLLAFIPACHGSTPPRATATLVAAYAGCYDVTVTVDSASVPGPNFSNQNRRSVDVPPDAREERYWIHLSAQELMVAKGNERELLAVRPLDPIESGTWRLLGSDTVAVSFNGHGSWQEEFQMQGSVDTLSGAGIYTGHTGYRSYATVSASRRSCPSDSLEAASTPVAWFD